MNVEPAAAAGPARVSAHPLPGKRHIIVGQSASRGWIVKDSQGCLGAVFRSPDVALRFARREAVVLRCSVVIDRRPVELDCLEC